MGRTTIGWTAGRRKEPGYTFNPWEGCEKEHTGCLDCYAAREFGVLMRKTKWGPVWQGGTRTMRAESYWAAPLKWARDAKEAGQRHRVFCASLGDVLESIEEPKHWPRSWTAKQIAEAQAHVAATRAAAEKARERLWQLIRDTAYALDWLLLSKRPQNWRLIPEDIRHLVWLGTSIADQATTDEYVPRLLRAEGFAVLFLSLEPMVGRVDLSRWIARERYYMARCNGCGYTASSETYHSDRGGGDDADVVCPECGHLSQDEVEGIGWVLVGGESGAEKKTRDFNLDDALYVLQQCQAARVPAYFKQLGRKPVAAESSPLASHFPRRVRVKGTNVVRLFPVHPKGEDPKEWPPQLNVQEHPRITQAAA